MPDYHRITELGDSALLVEFDQRISRSINSHVHQLDQLLRSKRDKIITYTIPAYCSLAVGFDNHTPRSKVRETIENALDNIESTIRSTPSTHYEIPVCFEGEFALDSLKITTACGMSWNEIKSTICAQSFQVFMIGFVAGFPYLGELPDKLTVPRHEVPRKAVERGSVAIAERQCGIYPVTSPGGWNIVGRTPLPILCKNENPPFWINPGDSVRFTEIDITEFMRIEAGMREGKIKLTEFHA